MILRERSIKTYSSCIRIILISESVMSERATSCEVTALPTFAYKIVRGFVDKGLVLIFKRGESV